MIGVLVRPGKLYGKYGSAGVGVLGESVAKSVPSSRDVEMSAGFRGLRSSGIEVASESGLESSVTLDVGCDPPVDTVAR